MYPQPAAWNRGLLVILLIMAASIAAAAQTTAFTYQGKLTDTTTAANGSYDFQFALFDQLTGGLQQPQPGPVTVTRTGVNVANGIFNVTLDFGVAALTGADRFIEISVKKGTDPYTTLIPRQQLTSSPYSVQTLNASQLGGVAANQYVRTTDSRLSDARPASSIDFNTATLNNALPISNGGTGAIVKSFVDLSTTQTVTGAKTLNNAANVFTGDGTALTLGQNFLSNVGPTFSPVNLPPGGSTSLGIGTFNAPASTTTLVMSSGTVINVGASNTFATATVTVRIDGADYASETFTINNAGVSNCATGWNIVRLGGVTAGNHSLTLVFSNSAFSTGLAQFSSNNTNMVLGLISIRQ
ncbi:MAG: hypothetical protein ACJ73D_04050 [Pyrinomonadaceae bacterium]